MTKRLLLALVLAVVAVIVACAFGGQLTGQGAAGVRTPTSTGSTIEERAVTAKGAVVPVRYARLGLPAAGTLARLLVKEGDTVKAGQTLARLDSADLELAVRVAEARLTQAKAGPRPEDIAVAESGYQAALAQHEKLKAGPGQEELIVAKANLDKAVAALKKAQAAYDQIGWMAGAGMTPQALNLEQATIDHQSAQAQCNRLLSSPTQAELKASEANVASARAQVDKAKAGPRPEDVAVAQAELDRARLALEKVQVVAPWAGTIAHIAMREGEAANAGAPAITLADLSELRVETTDLEEIGAARVKVGDPVRITVSAFKDKTLTGKVTSMALQSVTLPNGDVCYVATVSLDRQDPELRWGMTVKLTLTGDK